MTSNTEHLDVNWTVREVKNFLTRFRLWDLTQGQLTDGKKNVHLLWSVGKKAYCLILSSGSFKPANFVAPERDRFLSPMRQPDQKALKFILRVQAQAAKYDFADSLDSVPRDCQISGINNVSLKKKLQGSCSASHV